MVASPSTIYIGTTTDTRDDAILYITDSTECSTPTHLGAILEYVKTIYEEMYAVSSLSHIEECDFILYSIILARIVVSTLQMLTMVLYKYSYRIRSPSLVRIVIIKKKYSQKDLN